MPPPVSRRRHGVGVPVDELDHSALLQLRIRPRLVGRRVDPELVLLDHVPVLVVGHRPDLGQPLQVVIHPLDRVLVDEPLRRHQRLLRAHRQDAEQRHGIRQEVVPAVGIVEKQQRPRILERHLADQAVHGRLAVHRVALGGPQQRHPHEPPLVHRIDGEPRRQPRRLEPRHVLLDRRILDPLAGPRDMRIVVECPAERRMVARAMIALAVVLHHELPVAPLDDGALMRDLQVRHAVRRGEPPGRLGLGVEGRRVLPETDEHQPARLAAMHRLEPVLGRVEIRPHVARPQQPPVELVGPLMIRTDQLRRRPLRALADARAAVPARIVERPDHRVGAAHDDDRIGADLHRHVIAGLRDLAGRDREDPVAEPDPPHLDLEQLRVVVERAGQRMVRPAGHQEGQHLGVSGHLAAPRQVDGVTVW